MTIYYTPEVRRGDWGVRSSWCDYLLHTGSEERRVLGGSEFMV